MGNYVSVVNTLLFSYEDLTQGAFENFVRELPLKLVRWLVTNHPDNKTRKRLLRLSNVRVGESTVINSGFVVSDDYEPLLTIGARVAISPNVTVICASAPNNSNLVQLPGFSEKYIKSEHVIIDDDSWIGTAVVILPGVTIGKKAVVGAGSVVTKSIPDGSVVAGNPATLIRSLT